MNRKAMALSSYRMENAEETLATAGDCLEKKRYRDCINRSYYAAFYAIKAVLALEEKDFKRHKDAVAYFNHHYVAEGVFSREVGKCLGRLKRKREASDYDDFYVASYEETIEQFQYAEKIVTEIKKYIFDICK